MSDFNPFTRREFLGSGLALVSTLGSVPAFLSQAGSAMADSSMRTSSKPGVPEERVLVVVQLSGGNDGLNTVVPYGSDAYYKARPGLGVEKKDLLPIETSNGIALHKNLRGAYELLKAEQAAVVQGVGYPNPNRSHFASMDVWHSGITRDGRQDTGWIGRTLDQTDDASDRGMECIALDQQAPLATQGETTQPVTFRNPRTLQWDPRDNDASLKQAYQKMHQAEPDRQSTDPTAFVYRTACDAQIASRRVRRATRGSSKTGFPNTNLGRQLQKVSAMIAADLPTRVYYVAMGGFDTHANQSGKHANLLKQFGDAMQAFQKELKATGDSERVVTMAFSEFGRRVDQNGSGGTDHGTAGPMFLFGDHVRPGLLGKHPSLTNLNNNDLVHTVDFRSVYASLIDQWLKLDSKQALGQAYRQAQVLKQSVRT
jgi:uncharacterized protein (DUF1501 family)